MVCFSKLSGANFLAKKDQAAFWEIKSSYRYRLEGIFQNFRPPWSI